MTETNSPYSLQTMTKVLNQNFALILIAIAVFIAGFAGGSLWTENRLLKANGNGAQAVAPSVPTAGNPAPAAPQQAGPAPKLTDKDHIRGSKDAQVVLIEYSDFECPFCKQFHPTMQQVVKDYGSKVAWVYRHYPLPFHQNAQKEAEASECAFEQGGNDAFWKYGDAIISKTTSNGTGFALDQLVPLAKEQGLNESKFKDCLDSGRMAQHVKDDQSGGATAGINGTPGTIVLAKDGKSELISGALPYAQIKQTLDKYVK